MTAAAKPRRTDAPRRVSLHADAGGQAAVEYVLLLAVFGLALLGLARLLLSVLADAYMMTAFLQGLPMP
jgi:Flp pilus assembly pilin Flp